jgi:hypothetical protein
MSENYVEYSQPINAEQDYRGLENMSKIEDTGNTLLEALLLSGLSIAGVSLIFVISYVIYKVRQMHIYKDIKFMEKLGEMEHREEIELETINNKENGVYDGGEDRTDDNGGRGGGGIEEGGENDEGDKERSEE